MCRWLAYIGKPCSIEPLVYRGAHALAHLALHAYEARLGVQGDGGGLGWYGDLPDPGIYRNPGPAWADPNLRELTRHIESRVTFAHVRASSGAPDLFVNCHPFRHGQWLFMHNGQIGGFTLLHRGLLELLSDESFRSLQGGTDSELIFQLLVTLGLDDPPAALRQAVRLIEERRRTLPGAEPFHASFALSDGWRLWAVRWASDGVPPTLYRSEGSDHRLLVSEPLDEETDHWHALPRNSLTSVVLRTDGSLEESREVFL